MAVRSVLLCIFLIFASCGDDTSTSAADADAEGVEVGEGLAVRIAGVVDQSAGDAVLCPGGNRPCLRLADGGVAIEPGAGKPDSGEFVFVAGRLVDGALVVDEQLAPPAEPERDYTTNRCADEGISGPPPGEFYEAIEGDPPSLPEGFADSWDSDDGTFHIAVVGDDESPMRQALQELGVADKVCIVPGFAASRTELQVLQSEVSQAASDAGSQSHSSWSDAWTGTVYLEIPRLDQTLRAALGDIESRNAGVTIEAFAAIEVLNGTLGDYEAATAGVDANPDPGDGLVASCGRVVFSTIPPDLDEFPPLDADAEAALTELMTGPETAVEGAGFADGYRWSIASRTEAELVLFGQPDATGAVDIQPDGSDGMRVASFDQRDGAWRPAGWGGCRIDLSATGLGPATVAYDPAQRPNPADRELHLLINEQDCASGQAPVDREVVPVVTESPTEITIVVLVAGVEGGADCPSNPWHPITVTLEEPLGDRALLDGHRHPATPLGEPDL